MTLPTENVCETDNPIVGRLNSAQPGTYSHDWKSGGKLNSNQTGFGSHQWQDGYKKSYDSVKSYADLKQLVSSDDANTKIFTMDNIVPPIVDLLSDTERKELSDILQAQLTDDRSGETPDFTTKHTYHTSTVSDSAKHALTVLEETPRTNELSLDQFLGRITYRDCNPPETGRPLNTSISIRPFQHYDLFEITKHVKAYDDGSVGKCETNSYLVAKETLLPHLQELKTRNRVDNIDVQAVHIIDGGTYDHTYGPNDDYCFRIGLVKLVGTLKISNGVLDMSDLTSEATQDKKTLHVPCLIDRSESYPLIREKIEELMKQ
jgi:hypothetical protein